MAVSKPSYEVQVGDVTETIQLNGRVTPISQENLFFRVDGTVKEVLVQIGDNVKAGDVLARLDEPERYLAEIASAELALSLATRELEQIRVLSPVNLIKAEVTLSSSRNSLDIAMPSSEALAYYLENPLTVNGKTYRELELEYNTAKNMFDEKRKAYDNGISNNLTHSELAVLLREMSTAFQELKAIESQLSSISGRMSPIQTKLNSARANYDAALLEVAHWNMNDPASEYSFAELKV